MQRSVIEGTRHKTPLFPVLQSVSWPSLKGSANFATCSFCFTSNSSNYCKRFHSESHLFDSRVKESRMRNHYLHLLFSAFSLEDKSSTKKFSSKSNLLCQWCNLVMANVALTSASWTIMWFLRNTGWTQWFHFNTVSAKELVQSCCETGEKWASAYGHCNDMEPPTRDRHSICW